MRLLRLSFSRLQLPIVAAWLLLGLTVPLGVKSFLVPQHQPIHVPNHVIRQHPSCPLPQNSITSIALQKLQNDEQPRPSRRKAIVQRSRAILRRIRKPLIPIVGSVMFAWVARTSPVEAKMSHEVSKTPTFSMRPGMSTADMDDVMAGKADIKDHEASSTAATSPTPKPKESASKSIYGDDLEDEDDFDLDDDEEEVYASRKVANKADQLRAKSIQSSQSSQFATYRKEKTSMMYAKVGAGVFLPTFGTMFVREHFRQRKEEAYVQKGLEILEAQKAEYFNVTSDSENSDLEDELKGLKNNTTDTDDDDDDDDSDDDDDDDDDDSNRKRRKGPRRPRGGGDDDGGDSGSGGGSGYDAGGDDEVSDEDRDRLKNLFDKS